MIAHRRHLVDLALQLVELLFQEPLHLPARSPAGIAHLKDAGKLGERKPYADGPSDQAHSIERGWRIKPVIPGRALWSRQQLQPLVVAEGIAAHASQPGKLSRQQMSFLGHVL